MVFANKPKWIDADERDVDKPKWQFVVQITPRGKQVCEGLDVENAKPSGDVQGNLEEDPSSSRNNVMIKDAGATLDEDKDNIKADYEEMGNALGIHSDSVSLDVDHFGITNLLENDRLLLDRHQ